MSKKDFELKSIIICENAFFSEDKKLNIIGIFDQIFVDTFPGVHPFLSLATIFEGSPNQNIEIEFKILDPKNSNVLPPKKIEAVLKESGKYNFVLNIPLFPIKGAGRYSFQAYFEEKLIGETFLNIIEVKKGGRSVTKGLTN